MSQFVHLHLHTQYSLLDGVNKIPDVIERAHSLGQPAIAMTDHGNLHGATDFYSAAKKLGIKPIIGCEMYVTPGSRFERKQRNQGGAGTFHLTILAANQEGYRNLCKLSTLSYKEGFYFRPRVDHELLEAHSAGLVALSGCLASELSHFVQMEDLESARRLIEFYSKIFPNRYFLEIQPHPIMEQRKLNAACVEFSKGMGIPLVATTDCHYPSADDHYAQEILMCISTGTQISDPNRMRHVGMRLHLKTAEEMLEEFHHETYVDEALRNSLLIADKCNLEFDFNTYYMPRFDAGPQKSIDDSMADLARRGLEKRLAVIRQLSEQWSDAEEKRYKDRLEQEISMIIEMGFSGYFLICSDFIVWAKEQAVPVGPGRGSAAGSLVAYALRITDVDPIKHKLLFERFLNPKRVSLPDIDVDFCIYGREKVIDYVVHKFGADRVARIATFGTLKAKAAIKDVGRVLGRSFAEMDKVAELIPAPRQGFDFSLTQALQMEKRLAEYAKGEGKELIDLALRLEGLTRHASTHAAGVVIGDRPLCELLPLMIDKDGNDVTQLSMKCVEKIGLLKFDFLGLKTLTVIHTALEIILRSKGVRILLEKLPLEDPKTYSLLCAGNTTGVFQLESTGITEMTMRLRPNCFDDLVAILALYRPGPLDAGMVDHYIERKHGREAVSYPHPLMKHTLADTYGIILYQEQIMQLAQVLAGYSLGEADILRRAMGKKNPEEMAKQRDRFVQGATDKKLDKRLSSEIFNQMETFARYGFNRSHSAAYAMISFHTAYLKAHFPVEFMAALMSHEMDDSDKTLKNINECRKQKIKILPPDVNTSVAGFSVEEGAIRFGLSAVKGIGDKAVASIEAGRTESKYSTFENFLARVDLKSVNRRVLEALIKCGSFDWTKRSRRDLLENLDLSIKTAHNLELEKNSNQISLFGAPSQAKVSAAKPVLPEFPVNRKLALEREALGFYISGHPLEKHVRALKKLGTTSTREIRERGSQQRIVVAGMVTALRLKNTKKGDRYAAFALEDAIGSIDTLVWPDVYNKVSHLLSSEDPVIVTGRSDVTEERCSLIVENVESLIDRRDRSATQGLLSFARDEEFENRLPVLLGIFSKHSGNCPVKVKVNLDTEEVWIVLKDKNQHPICVSPSENLCDEVEQLFGKPVLSFV